MIFPNPQKDLFIQRAIAFLFIYGILIFLISIQMIVFMVTNSFKSKLIILRIFDVILWILPPAMPIYF